MASRHWKTSLKIEVLGWVPWEPSCTDLLWKAPDQHLSGNRTRQGEKCICDAITTKVGSSGTRAALKCCPALRQGGQTFISSQQTNHCMLAALGKGHNYGHGGLFEGNFHREDQLRAISYQHFQQQREWVPQPWRGRVSTTAANTHPFHQAQRGVWSARNHLDQI